jgi:predicted metallo-beta-lactamase superfamily hydrolase
MAATGVVEAIDVLKDGGFCLTPRRPALPPDEFRLQGFEEGLDGRIVVAISLAAH